MTNPLEIDWAELIGITILIFGYLIKWICITLMVCLTAMIGWCICRISNIKFASRINPNGDLGILITGATSGFGLALTKLFYKLGFTVFVTYYNDKEPGYKVLQELSTRPIESHGSSHSRRPYLFFIQMDVRSLESIEASGKEVDSLLNEYNIKLYSLINNAGVSQECPFEWCHRDVILNVINTNLTGTMLVTRQFLLQILRNKGRIINVSSGTFVFPTGLNNTYGTTKAAIVHFSRALHDGIERYGASCHCVIPGNFLTISNIVYPYVKAMLKSSSSLTPEEQKFYELSVNHFKSNMFRLLKAKLKNSGDDLKEIARIYNFEVPDIEMTTSPLREPRKKTGFLNKIKPFLDILLGQGASLENSNALEAFEHAVCLKNPPLRLYAGNFFYTYFMGPVLEIIPSFIFERYGRRVVGQVSTT